MGFDRVYYNGFKTLSVQALNYDYIVVFIDFCDLMLCRLSYITSFLSVRG